jgi:hypothetical protein
VKILWAALLVSGAKRSVDKCSFAIQRSLPRIPVRRQPVLRGRPDDGKAGAGRLLGKVAVSPAARSRPPRRTHTMLSARKRSGLQQTAQRLRKSRPRAPPMQRGPRLAREAARPARHSDASSALLASSAASAARRIITAEQLSRARAVQQYQEHRVHRPRPFVPPHPPVVSGTPSVPRKEKLSPSDDQSSGPGKK